MTATSNRPNPVAGAPHRTPFLHLFRTLSRPPRRADAAACAATPGLAGRLPVFEAIGASRKGMAGALPAIRTRAPLPLGARFMVKYVPLPRREPPTGFAPQLVDKYPPD